MKPEDTIELYKEVHEGVVAFAEIAKNIGKGASGAAVQNLNLMLGMDECLGLKS